MEVKIDKKMKCQIAKLSYSLDKEYDFVSIDENDGQMFIHTNDKSFVGSHQIQVEVYSSLIDISKSLTISLLMSYSYIQANSAPYFVQLLSNQVVQAD